MTWDHEDWGWLVTVQTRREHLEEAVARDLWEEQFGPDKRGLDLAAAKPAVAHGLAHAWPGFLGEAEGSRSLVPVVVEETRV